MWKVDHSALLTDSYHFSMVQAYLEHGLTQPAVFELFTRRMPSGRNFLVAAGAEQVLEYLENLRFSSEEIEYLRASGLYHDQTLSYLREFRFDGDVWALPEGTPFFINEPILRIRASLPQAQLVETRVINLLQFQSLIASKAARSFLVAQNKFLVDFGLRRAHGSEAGLLAARASFLAGFNGTSDVLAGMRFGIPVYGTMAHSFIEAHESESAAFENFVLSNPANTTLLIDTYDTELAAGKVTRLAAKLQQKGIAIQGVRLDSGDLESHARKVRRILDDGGLKHAKIFMSGDIDEFYIRELLSRRTPVDGFGVGTLLTTSEDVPFLNCAYKLEEFAGIARRKRSEGKATWPGTKQICRQVQPDGTYMFDILQLETEPLTGFPLLSQTMRQGKRLREPTALAGLRESCINNLNHLPASLRSILNDRSYEVRISEGIRSTADRLDRRSA